MTGNQARDGWKQFIQFAKDRCSAAAFGNWLAPIHLLDATEEEVSIEVPNVFVKEYLIANYQKDLLAFLPLKENGEPAIHFVVRPPKRVEVAKEAVSPSVVTLDEEIADGPDLRLNRHYHFKNFIEGPSNQFVKSAAMGVANSPGKSYNPLIIHGGVGLGKTHILHSIGHYVLKHHKKLRVQCITTEQFINDLVDSLRNKSVDKLKKFYRHDVDVLLIDDIQFLQNRQNFEEEFCNMFEALINQNKQIVVTSDKPPTQLKLSERMTARMEWGLVAHVGLPELETRVAIVQSKAEQRGLKITNNVAFMIAENMCSNIRQLEGAVNRLCAQARLMNQDVSEQMVLEMMRQMMTVAPKETLSVDQILKGVSTVFQVKVSDIKGGSRTKDIAIARQVAMFLARQMVSSESLSNLSAWFDKTHSTILHACKTIEKKLTADDLLKRQVEMVRRNLELT